jgi:flagellar biogenesis protein FliO
MHRTILRASTLACGLALAASPCRAETVPRHPIAKQDPSSRSASTAGPSSSGFWLGAGGIAAALAAFGAVSLAAKKARPGVETASLRVVGRASLSGRHAVYLLRVGDRTLILGTGGQGPPSLLGELAPDAPAPEPSPPRSPRAASLATAIGGPA